MHTHVTAYGRERNLLANYSYCFAIFAVTDRPNIAGNVYACGTGILTRRLNELLAYAGPAVMLFYVFLIFVPEITECAENRTGSSLPKSAQRGRPGRPGQFFQAFYITHLSFSGGDIREYPEHLPDAFAARNTFAAGLIRKEAEKIPGHINHAGIFIHDDHATGTHDGADFSQFVKVDSSAQVFCRNTAS